MNKPTFADFNQQQYQENFSVYAESNATGAAGGLSPTERVAKLTAVLPAGKTVFEIGSGAGLDTEALTAAGYVVKSSDYVPAFVEVLADKGFDVIQFDAKRDELPLKVDAIYANAVFVHFTFNEIKDFLVKAKTKLEHDHIVFLTVLKGSGSERKGRKSGFERDFYFHSAQDITNLSHIAGYTILSLTEIDDKWLQVIMKAK